LKPDDRIPKGIDRITIMKKLKGGEPKGYNGTSDEDSDEYEYY
jgi:hypothetical protein